VIAGQLYDLHAAAPYVTAGLLSLLAAVLLRGAARTPEHTDRPTEPDADRPRLPGARRSPERPLLRSFLPASLVYYDRAGPFGPC